MEQAGTVILRESQVQQRINRIAYQVYEDNAEEQEIIIAGIAKNGYVLAGKIADALKKISPLSLRLIEVTIDKHSQTRKEIELTLTRDELHGKVIILVDDVLNSGKTLMYSLRPFLNADIKKIRTVVLVDRNHKRYPVAADFVGLSLATTMQEHVTVEFEKGEGIVFLS
ncbi:MAG: phosphoribosyltransferase family protein [Bacteroidetes bacterium]|nr:phosphoribosyltransferase family protein [Bacteroidota bacterium]